MRLKRFRLQNFRLHRDSVLEIGDSSLVLIVGPNWGGKSTIAQGLSMCLTPTTAGLDPQGREFAAKIRRGESKAVLIADIQTKAHLIERTVTLNMNATGRTRHSTSLTDPNWNPRPFDKALDDKRPALSVALNTDAFLRMDAGEQKNLLAGLALPARYDFDPMIVAEVQTALGERAVNFEGEPFAAINQAYKKLYDERQVINRQVREFQIPDALPVPAGADSMALGERLTTLHVDRRKRQAERDTAVAEATKVEVERERIKAKKQSLLGNEKLDYLRRVAAGKEELAALTKEKKQAETVIDGLLRQLGKLEDVSEIGAKCPTCDQPIDSEQLKALEISLNQTLRTEKDRLFALHQKIKDMGDVEEAVKQIAVHEASLRELAAAAMPQPVLFDFQPYNQSIAEVDGEIEQLSAQLRPMIAAEERQKEIAVRQEQLADLKEKAMVLDQLVKYFDKDGIKSKLLGQYIGGFETKLNELMSAWGYSCALMIEPYSFDVTNARGDVIPVRELSGAERVMFSLAFQCAVARTAQIGMVVIDEVAMFLPEIRPVLYTRLQEMLMAGYLEQAILLVADSPEALYSSWNPVLQQGAVCFLVENGTVSPLPSTQKKENEYDRRTDQQRSVA
jgi:DNA repair exonuclease SbcCD ATPase subunit